MAVIPISSATNAGQRILAQPEQDSYAPLGAFDTGAAELGQLGANLTDVAVSALRQERYQNNLAKAQARIEAGAAAADHEVQVKTLAQQTSEDLATGRVNWQDAQTGFQQAATLIDVPKIDNLDGAGNEAYQKVISRNLANGSAQVGKAAFGAQLKQTGATVDSFMDALGKQAGMPNTDVDAVAAKLDSLDPYGQTAFGAAWDKKKQTAKDTMYFDATQQRLNANVDSMEGLVALKNELTGNDPNSTLSGKLDSNKRNVLIAQATTRIQQLQTRQDRLSDTMDALGGRAIDEVQQQIATGNPASADDLSRWATQVKGTQYESLLPGYLKDLTDTTALMTKPIDEQRAEVQRQQATIARDGASPAVQERVKRLSDAVDANIKQITTTPLLFAQNRTGATVPPIDFTQLTSLAAAAALFTNLSQRVATLAGLQKTYGPEVPMAPLLPQEAEMLKATITRSSDQQKESIFGILSQAAAPDVFAGMMKQLKADAPTTAAGMAAGRGMLTSEGNTVAGTLLAGASILKDKSAILPKLKGGPNSAETDALLPYFNQEVGDALPPGDAQRDDYFQIFRAAYAGVAQHRGTLGATLDETTAHGALSIATGGIGEWANKKVLKPYGMADDTFNDKVDSAVRTSAPSTDLTYDQLRRLPLQSVDETHYRVLSGRNFVTTKDGKPLVLSVSPTLSGLQLGIPR